MIEEWRDIKDYEGKYQISNYGRLKNSQNYILSPFYDKEGYQRIYLWKNGKRKSWLVHRLVANTFIKKPYNKNFVDHIDTIRDNNIVSNLKWVNYLENANNPITKNNVLKARKRKIGISINNKPVKCVETNIIYKSALEVEKTLGIYHNQVNKCCLKRKYYNSAGGYHWEYV